MKTRNSFLWTAFTLATLFSAPALAQNPQTLDEVQEAGQNETIMPSQAETPDTDLKFRLSFPAIILPQFFEKSWNDRKHTQHIELHAKYELTPEDIVGVKFASWRLFQPMGILWWEGLLDKVDSGSEFYPGHLHEIGLGLSYQRMLWEGLFASVEILPQYQAYKDLNNTTVGNGFKLYTSLHLGYHFSFGEDDRFFIEPQIHSQFWLFDTNAPDGFRQLDAKWHRFFLFEPNIYLGMKF